MRSSYARQTCSKSIFRLMAVKRSYSHNPHPELWTWRGVLARPAWLPQQASLEKPPNLKKLHVVLPRPNLQRSRAAIVSYIGNRKCCQGPGLFSSVRELCLAEQGEAGNGVGDVPSADVQLIWKNRLCLPAVSLQTKQASAAKTHLVSKAAVQASPPIHYSKWTMLKMNARTLK